MPGTNTPQRSARPKPPPIVTEPKKILGEEPLFQSDLPIEQAAYEGTVAALGYEPILPPYKDEALDEVYAKHNRNMAALRELSEE